MRVCTGTCQPQASFSGRTAETASAPVPRSHLRCPQNPRRTVLQRVQECSRTRRKSVSGVSALAADSDNITSSLKADSTSETRKIELSIKGLSTEESVGEVSTALEQVEGVSGVDVSKALSDGIVTVYAEQRTFIRSLMEAVRKLERGYRAVPYRERCWQWRGHKVNYSVAGPADAQGRPPVVAVHGFGGNCHQFRKFTADLCEQYTVYAPDLMGFGSTDKPAELTYDPHLWYQQVADFVAEVVREPCVLVGNSIGSQVSMYVASERPSLVKGICLLNCVGGMNQRGLYKDSWQLALMRPFFEILEWCLKRKRFASVLFSKFSNRDRVEQLLKMKGTPYANPEAVHSELVDIFVDPSLDAGAVDVFVGVFTGDPGPRPEKMLQKIECPVLVAWGDSDPWTPIDGSIGSFFQKQAKEQENIEFVPLANTGHSPQDDRPELVTAAMRPWLEKLVSKPATA